jgi:hypothetical protein
MTTPDENKWDRRLAEVDLPESRYKADLGLHDRSQAFSSELLKLALAGVAVIGFLLANFPKGPLKHALHDTPVKVFFSGAVIAFTLSVGFALLQRFQASSALFHHFQVLKFSMMSDPAARDLITENIDTRTVKFMQAHWLLKRAAWFLVIAALLLSIAFIRMLFLA